MKSDYILLVKSKFKINEGQLKYRTQQRNNTPYCIDEGRVMGKAGMFMRSVSAQTTTKVIKIIEDTYLPTYLLNIEKNYIKINNFTTVDYIA